MRCSRQSNPYSLFHNRHPKTRSLSMIVFAWNGDAASGAHVQFGVMDAVAPRPALDYMKVGDVRVVETARPLPDVACHVERAIRRDILFDGADRHRSAGAPVPPA